MSDWYRLDIVDVLAQLQCDPHKGLSTEEVNRRRNQYGPNELIQRGTKSPWRILWEQLTATLVIVLIVAAVISAALGDSKDAIAIAAIVVLNALLGFRQEYRAERAMAALKRLAVPNVKVRRASRIEQLSASQLVPGDIILLEAGDSAPADGRLLESVNLRVQESALTGESEPVEKDAQLVFDQEQALADRRNMLYMGTSTTYGRGLAIITTTGMQTELGSIASMLQTVQHEPTPLQRRLDQLGRVLALVALAIVTVIFALGLFRFWRAEELNLDNVKLLFMTAVSMAVAAVPEGLPAVVTIALALGAQRMLRRNALIRKLPAVESLGSVTTICSDKTGTLTKNEMTATVLDVAGRRADITQQFPADSPQYTISAKDVADLTNNPALSLLLTGAALCSDAVLQTNDDTKGTFHVVGDPTEGAMVAAAARLGMLKDELEQMLPRIGEVPFDSVRKRMTTLHRYHATDAPAPPSIQPWLQSDDPSSPASGELAFTKGAVDSLLEISTAVLIDQKTEPMTDDLRQRIWQAHDQLADDGMRVLGVAFRRVPPQPTQQQDELEQDLVFIGLVGMIDPPRPEAAEAVATCRTAGIRPLMITGDHPLTARYIAQQLGFDVEQGVMTGPEIDRLNDAERHQTVERVSVYARVSPQHKLLLVEALQDNGHVVAMTGDGVNDAPALKKADIGISMGLIGTDVAKEASEMILRDDNFATIVAAIEEGRVIFDNVRKFIRYLLSANSGELWVMLLAPFLGMPLPLLPLQILWMNLITDGFPALALGVEPPERHVMRRPPYPPRQSIFARGMGIDIVWIGLLMAVVSLGIGYWYFTIDIATSSTTAEASRWQTMLFTTLTLSQIALAMALRSERDSLFHIGLMSNKPMLGAVTLTVLLQLGVIYFPPAQNLLRTVPLSILDLTVCLVLSMLVFGAVELRKWLTRLTA